jgi:hypothetical protein
MPLTGQITGSTPWDSKKQSHDQRFSDRKLKFTGDEPIQQVLGKQLSARAYAIFISTKKRSAARHICNRAAGRCRLKSAPRSSSHTLGCMPCRHGFSSHHPPQWVSWPALLAKFSAQRR